MTFEIFFILGVYSPSWICVTVLCLYLGQCSVLSVSQSCPTACSVAFWIVYYWTNKDGWMDGWTISQTAFIHV